MYIILCKHNHDIRLSSIYCQLSVTNSSFSALGHSQNEECQEYKPEDEEEQKDDEQRFVLLSSHDIILIEQNTNICRTVLLYNPVSDYTRNGWREKRLRRKNLG